MRLISIDPGLRNLGAALYEDGNLRDANTFVLPKGLHNLSQACAYFEQALKPWLPVQFVAVEQQHLSLGRDGKNVARIIAVANDLLAVQAVGAYLAGRCGGVLTYVPTPKHDKLVTRNRLLHALKEEELSLLDVALGERWRDGKGGVWENCLDSVMIGLRAVGRYK